MSNTRSDTSNDTAETHEATVRSYLRAHDEVASKEDLRAGTDVPAWYIDQIATTDNFYTSLNHNGEYVASKYVVGHRSTHDGFWRPEVDDGSPSSTAKKTPNQRSNTSHSSDHPDSHHPKQPIFSVAVVTVHSDNLPTK